MKIAFFSDIHANLPALEAVLADIDQQEPDLIYCLGDLVGYNIWPNEVSNEMRKRKIPTIAGNYDEGIGLNSDYCGCAYKTDEEKANGAISIKYTNETVNDEVREYLKNLPRHMSLKFIFNEEEINLLMVHGSPRKINEYLFEDRAEKSIQRIIEDANSDILLFGHTHQPYHRILEHEKNGQKKFRHAINIGSVGKPKDGDPRACYVIMQLNEDTSLNKNNALKVEFKRVEYHVEKAAKAVEESILPNAYAEALRRGK